MRGTLTPLPEAGIPPSGRRIVHMTQGSNDLHFFYDAQNKPAMMRFNGTDYFYVYNLQGDVVAMIDANGTQMVEYHYDAWGNPVAKTGSMADTLGTVNPFRYRGCVYDEETGLYYLRSRYCNPAWKRFVNADEFIGFLGSVNILNVFAIVITELCVMLIWRRLWEVTSQAFIFLILLCQSINELFRKITLTNCTMSILNTKKESKCIATILLFSAFVQ